MNYIVGDIGNTLIKICILNSKFKTIKSFFLDTKKIYSKKYFMDNVKYSLNKKLSTELLFSSVVPLALKAIKNHLKNTHFKVIELKDLNLKKIIKINVKKVKQLGSDRIANAIGANKFKNCLILDFGTATTFDVIKNGIYQGGVIAPGINLSILNLNKSTALLPMFNLKKTKKSFGKNTKDALNSGFLWGYEGLINNIIDKIIQKRKDKYKIILTGGYANLFKKMIKMKSIIDQNITIKGITKVYKELL